MSALERFALDELSLWLELMFHSDEEISINGLSEDDEISGRIKDDELTPKRFLFSTKRLVEIISERVAAISEA